MGFDGDYRMDLGLLIKLARRNKVEFPDLVSFWKEAREKHIEDEDPIDKAGDFANGDVLNEISKRCSSKSYDEIFEEADKLEIDYAL